MRLHTGLENQAITALLHGEPQLLDCLPKDHHPEIKKGTDYFKAAYLYNFHK
jgi:hypothetical protein